MSGILSLAAVYEPGMRHMFSLDAYSIGKNVRAATPNVTEVVAEYFGKAGNLLQRRMLNFTDPICVLDDGVSERALLLLRIRYEMTVHYNVYGFLLSSGGDAGATYSLSGAIGDPERGTWLNQMVIPLSPPPPGCRYEFFIANPSRWTSMRYRLRLYSGSDQKAIEGILPPKGHHVVAPYETAAELGLFAVPDAAMLVTRSKAIPYILGRNVKTGVISFIEHFISRPRIGESIPPPPPPGRHLDADGDDVINSVFCYCTGTTLGEALRDCGAAHVGNYCTVCRDDLRTARQLLAENPALAQDGRALGRLLATAATRDDVATNSLRQTTVVT